MEMTGTAREVALDCLLAGEKRGAWSDGYLRNAIRQAGLSGRDAALCTRLAFGTLQNERLLDWHIARLCATPLDKLEPIVKDCLRLGLYQLLFLDRVPGHAAVNESVTLTKHRTRSSGAAGLVNAVLRRFDREGEHPQPLDLAVRYSHPDWLVEEFREALPAGEVEALLEANNAQPAVQAQVNALKTTAEALARELIGSGVTVKVHPWLPDCLELEDTGNLENLPAFREGRFYVQDAAARLAVMAADPQPGMNVLDACAAPGGKSFAAAIAMKDTGSILSCDLHPHKQRLMEEGAGRLGISIMTTRIRNAREFDPALESRFDLAIVDAPCSGLGVIRKKPDIRYKAPGPLVGLPSVQRAILENVSQYVKPGGMLLYVTCTLLKRENEDVVAAFLEKNPACRLEPVCLPGPIGHTDGMMTLWPHRHGTDGFFFARLRKQP